MFSRAMNPRCGRSTAFGAEMDAIAASQRRPHLPGQVNYVAKGANLYTLGYVHTGATAVALRHLNTTYLWDKVRVQGGAYGGSSGIPWGGSKVMQGRDRPRAAGIELDFGTRSAD